MLDATTVFDDAAIDTLLAGSIGTTDWFWATTHGPFVDSYPKTGILDSTN